MARAGMVTLIGRPNVGKSTLMNQMVGEKVSIITPTPQTTRNRICGIMNLDEDQVVFVDTPGLHAPRTALNRFMVEEALHALQGVDLILYLVDATKPDPAIVDPEGRSMVRGGRVYREDEAIIERLAESPTPALLLLNKIDRIRPKEKLLPLMECYNAAGAFEEVIPLSALTGDGLEILQDRLLALLPEGHPLFPQDILTDRAERFLVAEMIREQVILQTRDELPYACGVQIDLFDESQREDPESEETETEKTDSEGAGLIRIEATLFIERESQKGILIGKGGSRLKEIGTRARQQIEHLLACRVFLKLWVNVEKNWSQDEQSLRRLGYE